MYNALLNGETVTVTGADAQEFCDKYVQTVTEDGEHYIMPQNYPWLDNQKYEMVLEDILPGTEMFVIYLG